MARGKRLTREDQIGIMIEAHNGRYTYEKWGHPKSPQKSAVTCKDHGDFEQSYNSHSKGQGCPDCGLERRAESTSKQCQDPEHRAKMSEGMAKRWQDPEFREMMAKAQAERLEDPVFIAKKLDSIRKRINKKVRAELGLN